MLFSKKSKKGNPQIKTKTGGEQGVLSAKDVESFDHPKAKEGGIPLSIKATLSSAKKVPSVSAKSGEMGNMSSKDMQAMDSVSAKDPGHSEAYLQRMKKRLAK